MALGIRFHVVVTFFVLLPLLLGSTEAGGCQPLWTPYGDYCYRFFVTGTITWMQAELHCRGYSVSCGDENFQLHIAHLASVHSQGEQDFLSALYESSRTKRVNTWVWIGLTDKLEEDNFKWSDGTSSSYDGWAVGQPYGDGTLQDCTAFNSDNDYQWNDMQCGEENTRFPVESLLCKIPKC